mgnify:CR=1 FL=1
MTKHRPPLSVDAALARVAGQLVNGWDEMAEVTSRRIGLIRAWADPERRERIPLEDAILLDLAYRQSGGLGAPLFECYGTRLSVEGLEWFAEEVALGRHAVRLIKECGEAEAAVVLAAQPGATPRDRREALRQVEEAMTVLARARTMLTGSSRGQDPSTLPATLLADTDRHPPQTGPPD